MPSLREVALLIQDSWQIEVDGQKVVAFHVSKLYLKLSVLMQIS